MRISKVIKELQKILEEKGDLECVIEVAQTPTDFTTESVGELSVEVREYMPSGKYHCEKEETVKFII